MNDRLLNLISTLIFAFSQWLQIIIISNFLGNNSVGMYTLIIAITGPLVLLTRYSFTSLAPTESVYEIRLSQYKELRNILNIIYLIIVLLIVVIIDFTGYEKMCLILYTIFKYFENKEEFIYIENIIIKNIRYLAISKIIKSISSISIFSLLIIFTQDLMLGIVGLIASQVLVYLFYDKQYSFTSLKQSFTFNVSYIVILRIGLSLTIVGFLVSLTVNLPRYMIDLFYDKETLGVYATLLYFITLGNNLIITLNSTYVTDFAEMLKNNISKFSWKIIKVGVLYFSLAISGFILIALFGSELFSLIYGNSYKEYELEIILLGLYLILIVLTKYMEMILNVLNKYKIQANLHIGSFLLTILLSFLFIPDYGLFGAFLVNNIVFSTILVIQSLIIVISLKRRKHA